MKSLTATGLFVLAAALLALISAEYLRAEGAPAQAMRTALVSSHEVRLNRRPAPVYGTFQVEVRSAGRWERAGAFDANHRYVDHALTLPALPAGRRVRVAVRATGGGLAHLDSVTLDGAPPLQARGAPLAKLRGRENDVADITGKRVELVFAAPRHPASARLALRGRIESTTLSKTPLGFPPRNTHHPIGPRSAFYTYRLGDHPGHLKIDGELDDERLPEPLFVDNQEIGSGHPQSPTYAWVLNDETHLYVAIDLTSDNTMDGDLDYTAVYVKRPDGVRRYRVSVPERRWGRAGFTYTPRAAYQHKVYEFAIPLAELGPKPGQGDPLVLALEAYGTVAPATSQQRMHIARDAINHRNLVVYESWSSPSSYNIVGQMLDENLQPLGTLQVLLGGANSASDGEPPAIAFDSTNQRFLVAWGDPSSNAIKGRLINSDNTLPGIVLTLYTGSADAAFPALAFNSADGEYLLVWSESLHIYGQRIDASGVPQGSQISIETAGQQFEPAVAFNSVTPGYYAVYLDDENVSTSSSGFGVYGRIVSADGLTVGSEPSPPGALPGTGLSLGYPVLAFDAADEHFLVVYMDTTQTSLIASMRDNAGVYVPDFHNASSTFEVVTGALFSEGHGTPQTVFDSVHKRYFVVWPDQRSGVKTSLFGKWVGFDARLVDPDPTDGLDLTDPAVSLPVLTADYSDVIPTLAFDESCGNILMGSHTVLVAGDGFDEDSLVFTQIGRCSRVNLGLMAGYTTEQGTRDTFSVVLNARPTADVTIPISVSNTGEATVTPASLTFTSDNWMTPRQVIVTGVDDATPDGDVSYTIQFGAITSSDPTYAAISLAALPMVNLDDETAGFLLGAVSGPTTEGAGTATFTVALATPPSADVTIALSSSKPTEATVSPASLTFTSVNWSNAQTVTATGVDDTVADGHQPYYVVTGAASSADPSYSGRNPPDVLLFNLDDESTLLAFATGTAVVSPLSGPPGTTFTFTVVYRSITNSPPLSHNLNIDLDGDGAFTASTQGPAPARPGGPGALAVAALALLALLALGTVAATPRGLRALSAVLGVVLVLGVGTLIGLSGCGGGGGGGSSTSSSGEVIVMTPVDPADTNYLDGRSYTATRTIDGDPRTVTFRFSFSEDGTSPVLGEASGNQTLTVTAQ